MRIVECVWYLHRATTRLGSQGAGIARRCCMCEIRPTRAETGLNGEAHATIASVRHGRALKRDVPSIPGRQRISSSSSGGGGRSGTAPAGGSAAPVTAAGPARSTPPSALLTTPAERLEWKWRGASAPERRAEGVGGESSQCAVQCWMMIRGVLALEAYKQRHSQRRRLQQQHPPHRRGIRLRRPRPMEKMRGRTAQPRS